MSEHLLDTILLFKEVSASYWTSKKIIQDDASPLFFNATNGKPIDTKNMYNQAGFSEIGIPDLRAGLMRIHMTNQMFESGATSEQHVLMMAHSLSTARDSYFTKGTAEYNAGMAAIIDRQNMENPSDEVEDEMAQEAAQRRQELLQLQLN